MQMEEKFMQKKPEVVVIAGPNGSGKSTYTEYILGPGQFADSSFEYINADNIQSSIGCSALDAAVEATKLRELAIFEKRNFAFETVLSTRRNLDLLIKAKSEGYFIRCFYFVTVDSSINFQRVENRVAEGGHDVPKDKIESRYDKALKLIPELVQICDSINIWDNSTDRPYRIFQKKLDQIRLFDNPVWSKEKIDKLIK